MAVALDVVPAAFIVFCCGTLGLVTLREVEPASALSNTDHLIPDPSDPNFLSWKKEVFGYR